MVGSIKEKMNHMPRITTDADESFVVEVKKNGITIAEVMCHVQEVTFNPVKNESKCKLSVYNPHFDGKQTVTEYHF